MASALKNRRERGAAAVETAVIVGLFLIPLLIGIVDVARLIYTHIVVTEAAQEGAMYLASNEAATASSAETHALSSVDYTWNSVTAVGTCTTQNRATGQGASVTMTITEDVDLLFPFYGGAPVALSKTADGDRFYPC